MLKSLLGLSAAMGLLLAATTALAHPHQSPSSHHDRYDRVGRPDVERARPTHVDRVKPQPTTHNKQAVQTKGHGPLAKRAERVSNCSEFESCSGPTARPRGDSQAAKGSKSSGGTHRATSESYMSKVANMRLKAIIAAIFPGKGSMNGTNNFDP